MAAKTFEEVLKSSTQPTEKTDSRGKSVLFIGLKIANAEPLAIEGGENHEDFHITLAYGHFDASGRDEDDITCRVQYAVDQVKVGIPDKIRFDAIKRFKASESSDGKDVIYAQVATGQLEEAHDFLLSMLKEKGIKLEDTFPEYKPHMTLAYIEPGEEYELGEIDATGDAISFMIGFGEESSHEQEFNIIKSDDDKRLVFGWASISITVDGEQLEDRQKDIIDPEDLEEAAYEYVLNFRDTGEEHISTMRKKGKLVESCVFTAEKQKAMGIPEGTLPIGWWIGFKIEDDAAWARVKNGTYKMFSIEGKANREPVEKSRRDYDEYPEYGMWLEENLDATIEEQKAAKAHYQEKKSVAKTFSEILKFNPYHDAKGRFATSNGYATFTMRTKDPKKQHWADKAVARMKQQHAANPPAPPKPTTPPKPKKNYDSRGFADYDDSDYHQLHSGRQYYAQQKLSVTEQNAAANYLSANPEPGSLYSHCQNMNYKMATGQTLTGQYKKTYDGMMSSMHNIGYNVELTRYDHAAFLNGMLKSLGAGTDYERMSQASIKKALVGQTVNENKFLSTSYNNFKNATNATVFTSRAVKINYKVKANAQAMMPGKGPGGDFGEVVLAPTNGKANKGGKIVDVRLTGKMARRQGTQTYNQPQIEIDIEIG